MPRSNRPTRGGRRPGAGRPKGSIDRVTREIAELAQQYTAEAIERLAGIMRDPKARHTDQIAAISHLLDRGHGRPQQPVDLSLKYENLEQLTDDELTMLIRAGEAEGKVAKLKVRNGSANRPY